MASAINTHTCTVCKATQSDACRSSVFSELLGGQAGVCRRGFYVSRSCLAGATNSACFPAAGCQETARTERAETLGETPFSMITGGPSYA